MTEPILLERDAGVATITFNRPRALNAANRAMSRALRAAVFELERDAGVRCVVLRGSGGHFMAGGDLIEFGREIAGMTPAERGAYFHEFIGEIHPVLACLKRMPKPVLASVSGAAAGVGMSFAMAADIAIASEDAKFTLAYCAIGTSPDGGSTHSLVRLLGTRRAMGMALLGDTLDAKAALDCGLVNRVVPAAALEAETAKIAARLAAGPTRAFANTKRLLAEATGANFAAQLQLEAECFTECAATADFMEGIAAFAEKRRPQFSGS